MTCPFLPRLSLVPAVLLAGLALLPPAPGLAQDPVADGFGWVVQPAFEDAGSAQDGVVPLKQGGLWGLMGAGGQWIVPPTFDAMGAQAQGRFAAAIAGRWGVVDTAGREVLPFVHDAVGTPDRLTPVQRGGQWLLLGPDGAVAGPALAFDTLTGNEGQCLTGTAGGVPVVEWRGAQPRTAVIASATRITAPTEGIARAELSGGGWAHVYCASAADPDPAQAAADLRRVSQGMGAVNRGGLWGFDTHGRYDVEPIPPQFAAVRDFAEGLAPVQTADGKWGYVDARGSMVIPPRFDAAFGHSDGIAGVRIGEARGFIDRAGTLLIAPRFEDYWRHSGGVLPVRQGGLWGVIAPLASDPATVFDLPLADLAARVAARPAPISIVPSTPHFYSGQDIQSRHDISISPDGKVMLTVLTDDGASSGAEVALWDRESRQLIRKIRVPGLMQAVLMPGVAILAAGTVSGDLVLVDAVTGDELHRLRAHDGPVGALILSPDGQRLASLGGGRVRMWSLPDGDAQAAFRAAEQKIAFAPDGQSLWLADAFGGVRRTDLAGTVLDQTPGDVAESESLRFGGPMAVLRPDMALSPQGTLIRLSTVFEQQPDGSFEQFASVIVSGPAGRRVLPLPRDVRDVLTVDLSPDGTRMAYAGSQSTDYATVWSVIDLATGAPAGGERIAQGFGWIDRMRFTPEGNLVLIGGEGGDIREVSAETAARLATYGAPLDLAVGTVALPDGTEAYAVNGSGRVLVWDLAMGALRTAVETGVDAGVETYLGTDGRALAVVNGYDDTAAAAIDMATLSPLGADVAQAIYQDALVDGFGKRAPVDAVVQARLQALPGQSDYALALPMAGGRLGLISDTVGEHRVYDLVSGALLATFLASPDGEWLVLTPEGFFAASANGGRLVSVSDGLRSFAVDQVFQALYRPDLVQAKLAGDPDGTVAAAAAALDLSIVLGSGPAPRLRLSFPLQGARAAGELIEAGVEVIDGGGGVGRVEWRVNGQTAGIAGRAAEALTDDSVLRSTLALEPGENVIEVVAYNAAGLIASAPERVVISWDGSGAVSVPALHVLAIGVNDYADGRLRLTYAAADARAFGDAVARAGVGVFSSVNVVTLLDGQVTDAGLDAAFADLAGKVKPSDVFLFFIAGHGKTVEGEYFFIPADFTFAGDDPVRRRGISQDRWQEWMARIRARKSVMIYDTCESGSLTNTRGLQAALEQSAAVERLTRATGRTILSASTDDAPALEGYQGHGVMTYALLSALDAGDANGNATIEVTELAAYVDAKVPEFSASAFGYRQVPQMSIKGSDFALGARVAVLGAPSESFPKTMTHVVAGGTDVTDQPGGTVLQTIAAGAFVGVYRIEEKAGFARIARDGKPLGWVPAGALAPLQ